MTNCNIGAALHESAAARPDALALVTGRNGQYKQWSFRELLAESSRYANALQAQGGRPSMDLFQLGAVKPIMFLAYRKSQSIFARLFRQPFATVHSIIFSQPTLNYSCFVILL